MLGLLYFSLCCYAVTQILVYGKIFNSIRPKEGFFGDLFSCTMCTGFWVGLILWSINAYTTLFNFDYNLVTGFLLASLGSGVSYAISTVFGDDGIRIEKNDRVIR